MAFNNAWSNHRLLGACEKLTDEEFRAKRTSFFPSIWKTLNHIVTVDWFYVDALERAVAGQEPNPNPYVHFDPEEPFATAAPLRVAQAKVDRRLLALCEGLDAATLVKAVGIRRRAGLVTDSVTRILAHLFTHQIHHRGQAHAMLAGTSVAAPQLDDFFCANDAPLRADDFAELGFTESHIWG